MIFRWVRNWVNLLKEVLGFSTGRQISEPRWLGTPYGINPRLIHVFHLVVRDCHGQVDHRPQKAQKHRHFCVVN